MNPEAASCPPWMAHHLQQAGGVVPFRQFMDWALNDTAHGYYGAGQARIGPSGDFATSPSLGSDFADLLARQLVRWIEHLPSGPLTLVEVGPGNGDLSADLIEALRHCMPNRVEQLELVLVERNPAMRQRQRQRLSAIDGVAMRWCTLEELQSAPICGVVLAHELLDALPVERLIWQGGVLRQVGVALREDGSLESVSLELPASLKRQIDRVCTRCNIALPPLDAPEGWVTEWHADQEPLLASLSAAVEQGLLLVIDYGLEASRYYNSRRTDGTLQCFQSQRALNAPLQDPGSQDLTAHLCLDTLHDAASSAGWTMLDARRQGEALLALGLAQRLHGLQYLAPDQLAEGLRRREALLRLVDPAGLGDFRWLLYSRCVDPERFSFVVPPDSERSRPG